LHEPPIETVLGWWLTAQADDYVTLCAVVDEANMSDALAEVEFEWPDAFNTQFIIAKEADWEPGERFPQEDWMRTRFKASRAAVKPTDRYDAIPEMVLPATPGGSDDEDWFTEPVTKKLFYKVLRAKTVSSEVLNSGVLDDWPANYRLMFLEHATRPRVLWCLELDSVYTPDS